MSTRPSPRLDIVPETGSTNTDTATGAAHGWPDFSAVATANQTAGRGRLDRTWVAPPGQTLAVSVLLRPTFGIERFGWLPLAAGLAMARTVHALLADARTETGPEVRLKWPNDVQVDGAKVSGLLAELLPTGDGVVIGAGLNLTIPQADLPTASATSLTLHGANERGLFDLALTRYLDELWSVYERLTARNGDAEACGVRSEVESWCGTIGRPVRVDLPGGASVFGRGVGIDADGRLIFARDEDGGHQAVAAGDVTHLRYE